MEKFLSVILENIGELENKRVEQIVGVCGNGILSDNSNCSSQFRDFLKNVPTKILKKYADECLDGTATRNPNNGLILQDVTNEAGSRLGFEVEAGYYRGSTSRIGNDGLWQSAGFSFIVEVKTSDMSIKLENIAKYRERFIETRKVTDEKSSVLIILGRQDTGDLEAQIRGSKYAWSIRMIGIAALFRLLEIKENLNDRKTIHQITELLRPIEYTRVDKLIDVIFSASWDVSSNEEDEIDTEFIEKSDVEKIQKVVPISNSDQVQKHSSPVNFYEKCIQRINSNLRLRFIKDGRVAYVSSDKTTNLVVLNSKEHSNASGHFFWYGFRPNQEVFLKEKDLSFIAFGCGNEDEVLLIPYSEFRLYVPSMDPTLNGNGELTHKHVVILKTDGKYALKLPNRVVDVSKYVI